MQSTPGPPAIVVDRPLALVDVPIKIELTGFPAGQPVTITATLEFADTSQWQSRATFATDGGGRVDLTTFRGKPLPYLQENNTSGDPLPVPESGRPVAYAPFYLSHLRDARAVERSTIPVERTRGPIQLVSGTDDQMWGSAVLADIAVRRLQTRGHASPFRHLRYEGAGHLISVPYGPTTVRFISLTVQGVNDLLLSQAGTPRADAEAGIDAWRDLLQFLEDAASRHAP
jgi:BAAT / Acyl-CoA thioester hydrolase C terminal/Acyl-CoA thioester hydrolase/BAAT N-terminal region